MQDSRSYIKNEIHSERSFGLVFVGVFALVGLFPVFFGNDPRLWALGVALALLVISYTVPKLLSPLNYVWYKFGMLLGMIVAPLTMLMIYFVVFLPIGLLLRLFGKDLLSLKPDPSAKTYWQQRTEPPQSFTQQF